MPRPAPAALSQPANGAARHNNVEPIPRVPIALARRLYQIGVAVAAEILEPAGLIPFEFATLGAIQECPDCDQNTLAARMVLDRTTISALVFQLETKGLIEREVNDADRRARKLRLTPAGHKLHDRLRPTARAAQSRILAVLSPAERKAFLEMFVRVIEANREYLRLGAGRRKAVRGAAKAGIGRVS